LGPENVLAKDMWRQRCLEEHMLGAQQLERMREHLAASLRASSQLSERDIEVSGEGRRGLSDNCQRGISR
jgi:hypothetical protein